MINGVSDWRFGLRSLRKHPGFAAVAVLTLGLGIGANAAIFCIVNGLFLRPLPYADQERLCDLNETAPKIGLTQMSVSYPDFADWRDRNKVFDGLALYGGRSFILTGKGEPEVIRGLAATSDLFTVLGVKPAIGRDFRPEEDRPGGERVIIVSHGLWQNRFGGDRSLVGQVLSLNDQSYTVIGVMPPNINFPQFAQIWTPIRLSRTEEGRGNHSYRVVGKLKRGVNLRGAQANMDGIAGQLAAEFPPSNADVGITIKPLREQLIDAPFIQLAMTIFMGCVGFVLLIACGNVASLLLGRAAEREREIAVRTALGSGQWRVLRLLLAESLILGICGGALGLLLGRAGRDLMLAGVPVDIPLWMNFDFDFRVLGFVLLLSIATGIAFGLAPGLTASKVNLNQGLKDLGTRSSSRSGGRMQSVLVVAEVALALVLLIGAGLMMKGFLRLLDVEPGFEPENVATMSVGLPQTRYPEDRQQVAFFDEVLRRVRSLPGVKSAAAASNLPMTGNNWGMGYTVEGAPAPPPGRVPVANHRVVTPGYFLALGIRLIRGRDFDERDGMPDTRQVIVVDESLANLHWPGADPLGKRLKYGGPTSKQPWMTVIGVVRDVRHYGLDREIRPGFYVPMRQMPRSYMTVAVRTSNDPLALMDSLRAQIWEVDRGLPVRDAMTMNEIMERSLWQNRLTFWVLQVFAIVALVLAAVGIYGVVSYSVNQRTREIGVRMALGAGRRAILGLVIRRGMFLTVFGVAIGLASGLALTRVMSTMLFGISATDPATFGLVGALLILTALLACYIPARRASRVDPIVALCCE
jgi:putative ABC transport system permease protein